MAVYQFLTENQLSNSAPVVALEETSTDSIVQNNQSNSNENIIQSLQKQYNNEEIKAILSIKNTNFRYPVAQTTNNDFYLTHDYSKNQATLGAIYADYRTELDQSKKILIYGHSSSKTKTPFNDLENYYDEEYYQNNKYITLETTTNTYRYEIFSVYVETSDFTYMNINFESSQDWYLHILKLQAKSMYATNVSLTEEDDILILQTCSKLSKYKNNKKKYLLIVSRRVK